MKEVGKNLKYKIKQLNCSQEPDHVFQSQVNLQMQTWINIIKITRWEWQESIEQN